MGAILLISMGYTSYRLFDNFKRKKAGAVKKLEMGSATSEGSPLVRNLLPLTHITEESTPAQKHKVANHYLYTSVAATGSSILQNVVPPLRFVSLALLVYSSIPMFRTTEYNLIEKKKACAEALNTIVVLAAIGSGQYVSAALVGVFYYLGHKILARTRDDSNRVIQGILNDQPRSIWVLREGAEIEISLKDLRKEDTAIVHASETFPVDGVLVRGSVQVDQHVLNGEFQPVEKTSGDEVFASTMVIAGKAYVRVKSTGQETVAAQTQQVLEQTTDFKAAVNQRSEYWVEKTTLPTLIFSALHVPFMGIERAIVVLNSAKCVNRTRILISLDTLNHLALAAHKSVLVKDGRVLELLGNVDTVLFDKTGTLTEEQPEVSDIIVSSDSEMDADQILYYAAVAEYRLSHPIAKAIIDAASARDMNLPDIDDTNYRIGYGIHVQFDGLDIRVGSARFMESEQVTIPNDIPEAMESAQKNGNSGILVAVDDKVCGVIELHAIIRADVPDLMKDLRELGIKHFAIVSGDHEQPTRKLAESLNMDAYFANVLPHEKAEIVDQLQQQGHKVCFIGDGINDSIAMKKAQVSVSLAGASAIAMDTAQIILTEGDLADFSEVVGIARELKSHSYKSMGNILASSVILTLATYFANLTLIQSILFGNGVYISGLIHSNRPLRMIKEEKKAEEEALNERLEAQFLDTQGIIQVTG